MRLNVAAEWSVTVIFDVRVEAAASLFRFRYRDPIRRCHHVAAMVAKDLQIDRLRRESSAAGSLLTAATQERRR
jgi:hypothetical protein